MKKLLTVFALLIALTAVAGCQSRNGGKPANEASTPEVSATVTTIEDEAKNEAKAAPVILTEKKLVKLASTGAPLALPIVLSLMGGMAVWSQLKKRIATT